MINIKDKYLVYSEIKSNFKKKSLEDFSAQLLQVFPPKNDKIYLGRLKRRFKKKEKLRDQFDLSSISFILAQV